MEQSSTGRDWSWNSLKVAKQAVLFGNVIDNTSLGQVKQVE